MTAHGTVHAPGPLPYTTPDPPDAPVLRDAAHMCHLLAARNGGADRVDLTDRRDKERRTEHPAPPRRVDLAVLNGLARPMLRLLSSTFTDAECVAGTHLPRQCLPPEIGWFGTHRWPTADAHDRTRHAVDVLRNSELPEDLQELGELLQRVVDVLANLAPAGPSVMRPASPGALPYPIKDPR